MHITIFFRTNRKKWSFLLSDLLGQYYDDVSFAQFVDENKKKKKKKKIIANWEMNSTYEVSKQ